MPAPSPQGLTLLALAAALQLPALSQPATPEVSLNKKMVWAHSMMSFPLDLKSVLPYFPREVGYEAYGATYPLFQEKETVRSWVEIDLEQAKAAGLDGLAVDVFTRTAEHYLKAADAIGGIAIAPCLDLSVQPKEKKEAAAIETIIANCKLAQQYRSAAKIGDATLIFTYGTEQLPPEAWDRVRQAVTAAGYKTYWVASVDTDGKLVNPDPFPRRGIEDALRPFEAGYLFGNHGADKESTWNQVVATFAAAGKPFAGGMSPGYFRYGAGYTDARATATYRESWARHLRDKTPWAAISTWNDYQETTSIGPSADFNTTRPELTHWYSTRFKGQPSGWKEPKLYITAPKSLYRDGKYLVEGLGLNPTNKRLSVSVQLLDNQGRNWGNSTSVPLPPNDEAAANLTGTLTAIPVGHVFRAKATLLDGKKVLSSVISAPILVMEQEAQPGYERALYYSIPAQKVLPGKITLNLDGLPTKGTVSGTVVPPPGTKVRSAEILQNTVLAKNFFREAPFTVNLPRRDASGAIPGGSTWGFYVARVVDEDYRVGYSDPIYIAPPGDVSVKEHFDFNTADANQALDSSVFGGRMRMGNVDLVDDGHGGKAASFSPAKFKWSANAPRNLDPYRTPAGPLEISMRVRPRAFGGIFYADAGGLWVSTNADGTVNYTRLKPNGGGWSTTSGKTPLPLNAWSEIKTTWDGTISRIYVNGKLDGEAPAPPAFTSNRRALGYNPYNGTELYDGDIDDFHIQSLPQK